MSYVTQGTVQVSLKATGTTIVINPVSDYRVKHRSNDYTVFVEQADPPKTSKIFPILEPYKVKDHPGLAGLLATAAAGGIKIAVEIEEDAGAWTVVATTIPAMTTP